MTLFSDASMCQQSGAGGWAAWLKCDRGAMRFGSPFGIAVREICVAEAMAVVNGLSCGLRSGLIEPGDEVLVQTDNDSVMGILEGTARRTFLRTAKKRKGVPSKEIRRLVKERNIEISTVSRAFTLVSAERQVTIRWRHVKGHRGKVDRRAAVNTLCDVVARGHMQTARGRSLPTLVERNQATESERSGARKS